MTTATAAEEAIQFTSDLTIQAADSAKPQVSIVAYTGALMDVGGAGQVVVDLLGMSIPENIPLLSDHENSARQIAGQLEASHDGRRLTALGFITQSSAAGRDVLALHKDGIRFQASIGAKGSAFELVRPGKTVEVNGQQLKLSTPFRVARQSVLKEISIVAIGADGETSVDIAAKSG